MESDQNNEIDPELWLQFLLMISGDKERWEQTVREISQNTGLIPEKVENILQTAMKYLANRSRSN